MKIAQTLQLGNLSTYRYSVDAYDSTKLGIGPLIYQISGGTGENSYAGPAAIGLARPMEQSVAIPSTFPWAMQWQNNTAAETDWIFLADNSTAAATRRIIAYSYNRRNSSFNWKGFITVTFPTSTSHTVRSLRMTYDTETSGTVAVVGVGVTGISTQFKSSKISVGNRIGFGATSPNDISTWYEISAINTDTSLTLGSSASTHPPGTPYVVEDLKALLATTNATFGNGGVFLVKGLNIDYFGTGASGGIIVPGATTDNIRACYWLSDATVSTGATATGLILSEKVDNNTQFVYQMESTTNPLAYKYNLRSTLSLTAGKDTTAFQYRTGIGGTVVGTISQANNGRHAITNHGPYGGTAALYFTTTTRIYGVPVNSIQNGSTTWLSGGSIMTEIPPGGINTFAASAAMNSIEYTGAIDKFLIATNATTTPFRSYLTQFRTDAGQFDRVWGFDNRQIDQSTADASLTPTISTTGGPYSIWSEGGLCYIATIGTTQITNRLYAIPLSADWEYTNDTNSILILPAMNTTNVDKFTNIFASNIELLGGKTDKNLGIPTEPHRVSYRTSGITDNSGGWTIMPYTGSISAAGASQIQLKIEFRTMGTTHIPTRITTVCVVYEDNNTDSHYQFSVTKSSATNKQFSWRFSTAFGSSVPSLRVRLYNAVSAGLLIDDNTTSPTGTFERSTDGNNWSAWNNTDKGNETTYLRYTPVSLADNINVRPVLTQL